MNNTANNINNDDLQKTIHQCFMEQALPHLIGGAISCLLMLWLFYPNANNTQIGTWVACIILLCACTVVFYSIYYIQKAELSHKQWSSIVHLVSLLWGICLALPPILLLNNADVLDIFLYILFAGAMSIAPAPALTHYLTAYLLFITPISIASALLVFGAGLVDNVVAVIIIIVYFKNIAYGFVLNKNTIELISLRIKNEKDSLEKSKLIAIASHDIKQPLQAMKHLLHNEAISNASQDKNYQYIIDLLKSNTHNISELVDHLLGTSITEEKINTAKTQTYSLLQLTNDTIASLNSIAKEKGLSISADISPNIQIYVDRILFQRVLMNFIANAIKYTTTGVILIQSKAINKNIKISVIDTGMGINSDEKQKVFDAYYQANPNDSKDNHGLGLNIVKRICNSQQWKFGVKSEQQKGSEFYFICPLSEKLNKEHTIKEAEKNIILINSENEAKAIKNWTYNIKSFKNIESFYNEPNKNTGNDIVIINTDTLSEPDLENFAKQTEGGYQLITLSKNLKNSNKLTEQFEHILSLQTPIKTAQLRRAIMISS